MVEARSITPRSPRAALEPDRMPEPKRPSARARHPIIVAGSAFFTLVLLAAFAAGVAFTVGKQRFESPGPLAEDKIVNIPQRVGVRDIADLLQREGVIDQPWVFIGSVWVRKAHGELKYGEYLFPKQASLHDVINVISEGKVIQHQLTVAEGLTSEQIVARLMENDVLTGNIKEIPKEGSLLPETYNFTRGTSREQIIQRMQHEQRRMVQEIWERRSPDLPIENPDQLVVLASIIEKETSKPEERTRVAAVFVNRLKQRMRLQSDPTIIYGIVGGKGSLGRPITRSDIDLKTRYNTYVIDGLPPGPIANPGRASLEAAASPARTKELYFVADGTGGHSFSESLDQHQKGVARLRQIEAQQKDASGAEPQPALRSSGTPAARPAPPRTLQLQQMPAFAPQQRTQ
ncbi:MAG: endolytic transglycosylase MltG [Bradyrhizobiaceae bacterium]|nr:endolytic transglycosylase MltG [Hyphomicrobiales bacterium]MBV9428295.1 endolytic transglycosylase MltG [Bradyrhizobiaceae bacterium]